MGRREERGMEVGGKGDYIYTYRHTVTSRMTPALRFQGFIELLAPGG